MEDFFKTASFEDGLLLVSLMGTGMHKEATGIMDTLKSYWDNPEFRKAVGHVGIGAGVGTAAGAASSLLEPEHRRRPLSRAMTGALLGALGGGGVYTLGKTLPNVADPSGPEPPAATKHKLNELAATSETQQQRADTGAAGTAGSGLASMGKGIMGGNSAQFGEGVSDVMAPTKARLARIADNEVPADRGFIDHEAFPEVAGVGGALAGAAAQRGKVPAMRDMLANKGNAGVTIKDTHIDQLNTARERLKAEQGMSDRKALKTLHQEGGAAADNAANKQLRTDWQTQQKQYAADLKNYQETIAARQREISGLRKLRADFLAKGDLVKAVDVQRRLDAAAKRPAIKKPKLGPAPTYSRTTGALGGQRVRDWARNYRKPSLKGRFGRSAVAGLAAHQLAQWLQNAAYDTSDDALNWQAQQTAAQEAAARAAAESQ